MGALFLTSGERLSGVPESWMGEGEKLPSSISRGIVPSSVIVTKTREEMPPLAVVFPGRSLAVDSKTSAR